MPGWLDPAMTACGFSTADRATVCDLITRRGVITSLERDASVPRGTARLAHAENAYAAQPPLHFTWRLRASTYDALTPEQLGLLTAKAILLTTLGVQAHAASSWPEVFMALPVSGPDAIVHFWMPYGGADAAFMKERWPTEPRLIGSWDAAWIAETRVGLERLVALGCWLRQAAAEPGSNAAAPDWLPPGLRTNHARALFTPLTILGTTTSAVLLHRRPKDAPAAAAGVEIESPTESAAPQSGQPPTTRIDPVNTHVFIPEQQAAARGRAETLFPAEAFGRHAALWPRTCALLRLLDRWEQNNGAAQARIDIVPGDDTARPAAQLLGQALRAMLQRNQAGPTEMGNTFQSWIGAHRRVFVEYVPAHGEVAPEATLLVAPDTLLCLVYADPATRPEAMAQLFGPLLLTASRLPEAQGVRVWLDRTLQVEAARDCTATATQAWETYIGATTAAATQTTSGPRRGHGALEFDPKKNPHYLKATAAKRVAYEAALKWLRAHTQALGDANVPRPDDSRATVMKKRFAVMRRFHDAARPDVAQALQENPDITNALLVIHWQAILAIYPSPKRGTV
ncbi:MAG: hypothetical protein HY696_09465 [Deltaproteobacteria bacterium]|nr:hypothetical protein [Deltaproteobacteria bacterium]